MEMPLIHSVDILQHLFHHFFYITVIHNHDSPTKHKTTQTHTVLHARG